MKTFAKKFLKVCIYITLVFIFLALLLFCLFEFGLLDSFALVKFDPDKLAFSSSTVYMTDINKNEIKHSSSLKKNLSFNEIPKDTINAFISIEDKDFYKHHGVNYKRIVKATLKNLVTLSFKEGASTITQQLIKNTHLTSEKTLKRKFNEILLARTLEKNLTKDEIITAYLNAIYFGNGTFGINEASQRYFSKNVEDLTLSESATLAGIIRSPKTYSPIIHPDASIKRRNLVLREMYKDKKITKEELDNAINSELNLNINKNFLGYNDYYNEAVDEACGILKISEKDLILKGYKINTYLNPEIQDVATKEINNLESYTSCLCDGLVMTIDNKSGGITSFIGKSDYNLLSTKKQPGSVLKPIISYAPAIENNIIVPQTPILDEEITINGYTPHNYKNKYHGYISAKTALANSYNIPSVKVLDYVGIERAKNFAVKLGLEFDKKDAGYSIALGGLTNGVYIKDLTNCYQAFANNGKYVKASFIKSIKNKNGDIIYQNQEIGRQVMKDSTAYLITDMLKESVKNGTCKKLNLKKINIASKTGTVGNTITHKNTDVWNLSYTPTQTMCVYIGANSEGLASNITGSNAPSNIAQTIYLNTKNTDKDFEKPKSVITKSINDIEYSKYHKLLLASSDTPDRYKINCLFPIDNTPKETSTMFDIVEDFEIQGKKENNKIVISFVAEKYLNYVIYCQNEDNTRVLSKIKDKQGLVTIYDDKLRTGNFYTYYAVATLQTNKNVSRQSNSIKFYLT